MQRTIDLDALLDIAGHSPGNSGEFSPIEPVPTRMKLAVARDEAFCFYYEDNLDQLRRWGAEIVPFSPLRDGRLPDDICGIYLGGGYPELHAARLSENQSMLQHIRACCRQDMPVYAECGGLIYLTEGLRDAGGQYSFVGALPGWCDMSNHLTMGYREVGVIRPTMLSQAGAVLRGHEFHYSEWKNPQPGNAMYRIVPRDDGDNVRLEGYAHSNLLASYIHLQFAQNPELAGNFVRNGLKWREKHHLSAGELCA